MPQANFAKVLPLVLAHEGGYILAPANHLQDDTPPENVRELFRYAKEYSSKKH